MLSLFALPLLAAAVSAQTSSGSAPAASPTINTPTIGGTTPGAPECQPLQMTFGLGTPPYIITVNTSPAGTTPLVEFDNVQSSPLSWTVNVTLNTQLLLTIKDSLGSTGNSAAFPVTSGSGDSCITGGSSGGSSPSSAGSGSGGSSTGGSGPTSGGSSPATSSSGSAAGSTSTKPSGTGSSSTSSATNSKAAAVAVQAPAGLLPAFGAIVLSAVVALAF